jgi:hypothetical protein
MHVIYAVILIFGALAVLVLGLASAVRDLMHRDVYAPPAIDKDPVIWQHRSDTAAGDDPSADPYTSAAPYADAGRSREPR